MPFPRTLAALLLVALSLPLILSQRETNYVWDEANYHLPAIRQIREHWPQLHLVKDSLSATAPGYHYFLATVSLATGTSQLTMRLLNLGVSVAVLLTLGRAWPRGSRGVIVLAALIPLAASNFFVKSASYVVTDNAALLAITSSLVALLFVSDSSGSLLAGAWGTAAVFVRQSAAWLLAPLAIALAVAPVLRRQPLLWTSLIPVPVVVALLYIAWSGPVPPIWQQTHHPDQGLAFSAIAYELAVFALLGVAYYLAVATAAWRSDLVSRWSIGGAIIGLFFAFIGPTEPGHETGRWGGYLWNAAALLPSFGGRSLFFMLAAPLGGVAVGMLLSRLWVEAGKRATLVWLAALGAWSATGLVNRQVFHRYFEPTILVLLICWIALILRSRAGDAPVRLAPLWLLGVFQVVLTVATAYLRTFGPV